MFRTIIIDIVLLLLSNSAVLAFKMYNRAASNRAQYVSQQASTIADLQPTAVARDIESSRSGEKQFNWEQQWYPLAVEEFTDKSKPNKVMLLGNDVVLWFDGTKWCTFDDSCPHRGVPLSEGRVEKSGELLCAYHAWRFDGSGHCTAIPQSESKEKEKVLCSKTCVPSYPTQVIQVVGMSNIEKLSLLSSAIFFNFRRG